MKREAENLIFIQYGKNVIIYGSFQYYKHTHIHHKFTERAYIASYTWRKIFVHVLLPLLHNNALRRSWEVYSQKKNSFSLNFIGTWDGGERKFRDALRNEN